MLRAPSDLAGHKGINVELLTVGPEPAGGSLPRLPGNEKMRAATPKVTRAAFRYQRAPLGIFVSLSGGTDAYSFCNAMAGTGSTQGKRPWLFN